MSVELISAMPRSRSPVGVLADGTLYYAPIGEVAVTGPLVTCHLCGRSLRSVTAHLRGHGWTKLAYCEAFGLERGQSLEGPETRKLRAAALASRLVFEPAMRQGSAAGRARARAGDLTRDAVRAARGRSLPEQRRRKAMAALAAIPPPVVAQANRDRASRHLPRSRRRWPAGTGTPTWAASCWPGSRTGPAWRRSAGRPGSTRTGCRAISAASTRWRPRRCAAVSPSMDVRWLPAMTRLGFPDVPSYLRERHISQHWTVNAIAAEVGLAHHTVEAALRRHGLARTAHAAKRHQARQRAVQVAARLGFDSITDYVASRRGAGWTWQAMAAECAQPPSWLRRQAQAASLP